MSGSDDESNSSEIGAGIEGVPTVELLRAMSAASLDALITINSKGIVLEFSPAAVDLFGYTREQALGCPVAEVVIPPRLRSAHQAGLTKFLATGEGPVINARVEVPAIRKDGTEFPAELTVVPLLVSGQYFFTAFVRDISELKAQQAEVAAARDAAQQADRSKSRFLASMSHELRTPLNAVMGTLDLLQDTGLDPRSIELVTAAIDSGSALLDQIDTVLDFARMESDGIEISVQNVSLHNFLAKIVARTRSVMEPQGLEFRYQQAFDLPATVRIDPRRVRQVLMQLLDNARKFTHCGSVTLIVSVEWHSRARTTLHFSIIDTGIGIDEGSLGKIFTPFFASDADMVRPGEGAGIGLSIARRVATAMGGDLKVQSEWGVGSDFRFSMAADVVPGAAETPALRTERNQILLVEDGATNRLVATAMLTRAGYVVEAVENGEQAVAAVRNKLFDAVLMDLRMPVMNGFDATRLIRAGNQPNSLVPVIAVSANVSEEDRKLCRAAGMNDFVAKPIDRAQLLERLQVWCGGGIETGQDS